MIALNNAREALMEEVDRYETAIDESKNASKQFRNMLAKRKI